jgi:LuxR family maltose regulon positive regulatory protein
VSETGVPFGWNGSPAEWSELQMSTLSFGSGRPVALLTTKLHIPPARPDRVSRPRLIERLDAGLSCDLTLISAPAGFGKTTLLADWATQLRCGSRHQASSQTPSPVGWLSLDSGDNDPARFLAYLAAALRTAVDSMGQGAWQVLQSPQPPPAEEVLTALIDQVATLPAGPGPGLVLILDDYHLIAAQAVHDALMFLIDGLPSNMHLVIATRADPPLPIARLRARGQLVELRQADLCFTPDEAAAFLDSFAGLDLATDEVATLTVRTEGWIAGLQMAAVSIQGREPGEIPGFIRAFTGTNRTILDYLVEEVLQRQPVHVQAFLLRTAILDRLTAPLCDAILGTGHPNLDAAGHIRCLAPEIQDPSSDLESQAILVTLESSNLFIIPLDDEHCWYRYHRLFADLLRKRLHQWLGAEGLAALHQQASVWYERNGLLPEAVEHALRGRNFEQAARLIEKVAGATFMRSEVATFLSWMERLPDELARARPALCLLHAWALLLTGRPPDAVESHLHAPQALPGHVAPLRAFIAAVQGRIGHAQELCRQALAQLPEDDLFLRGIATWNLGIAHMLSGEPAAAGRALQEAVALSRRAGNVMIAVMALCSLAELHAAQTQLDQARALYQQALELATGEGGRRLPIAGLALIGLGDLSREWNDLEAATRYLSEGIKEIDRWAAIGATDGYLALARVRQAQGDAEGACEAMDKAEELALRFSATDLAGRIVAAHRARLWLAQALAGEGDAGVALDGWFQERGLHLVGAWGGVSAGDDAMYDYHLDKHERLTAARVLLAWNRPQEALALLEPMLALMEQWGGWGSTRGIELQILVALASQALGDVEHALEGLQRALSLAGPAGYMRLFLDEGQPMASLLRHADSQGIAPRTTARLLASFQLELPSHSASPAPSEPQPHTPRMIEPLTPRELEVLAWFPTSRSSKDIAQELGVSADTVRYHTKNIYGKLGVHRRFDAIRRARELGLL